jgi:hypothetical protein
LFLSRPTITTVLIMSSVVTTEKSPNMTRNNSSNNGKKRSRSTRKKRNKDKNQSSLSAITTKIASAEVLAEAKIITTTTTIKNKKNKKPRHSKSEKRIRKEQKLLSDDDGQNNNQNQKQQKQKQKQDVMMTKIDRILKCADQSLFTGSVIIDDNDSNDGETTATATNKTETSIQIVSGCDWNKSKKDRILPTMTPTMALLSNMGGRKMTMTRRSSIITTATTATTIRVKPLIILDINGILCHRIRKRHYTTQQNKSKLLRSSIGMVAQTPVIPRTDLYELFNYLDEHFCLAIWTSAKRKTVKKLLDLLLLPNKMSKNKNGNNNIQSKFLFVWCQTECTKKVIAKNRNLNHSTRKKSSTRDDNNNNNSNDDDDDNKNNKNNVDGDGDGDAGDADDCDNNNYDDSTIIYEKHLSKVFKAFPLWSTNNTLLVDDSPEKCPVAISNCIHPPPIHGGASRSNKTNNGLLHTTPVHVLSDEENEQRQTQFFQKLVKFWNNQPYSTTLSSSSMEEDEIAAASKTSTGYYQFLQENAEGYMGWRGHGDLAINKTS